MTSRSVCLIAVMALVPACASAPEKRHSFLFAQGERILSETDALSVVASDALRQLARSDLSCPSDALSFHSYDGEQVAHVTGCGSGAEYALFKAIREQDGVVREKWRWVPLTGGNTEPLVEDLLRDGARVAVWGRESDVRSFLSDYVALDELAARDLSCPRGLVSAYYLRARDAGDTPMAEGCGRRVVYQADPAPGSFVLVSRTGPSR